MNMKAIHWVDGEHKRSIGLSRHDEDRKLVTIIMDDGAGEHQMDMDIDALEYLSEIVTIMKGILNENN